MANDNDLALDLSREVHLAIPGSSRGTKERGIMADPEPGEPEDTYIGFLFPDPERSVDDIASTVAGDLRRLFVGFPASGEWRLLWAHCAAGLELLITIDSNRFDDAAHQQLTDVLLSGGDHVRVMTSHEIHDLLARLRDAFAEGATRAL